MSSLSEFWISVLASVFAYLLTLRVGDWLKKRHWFWHLGLLIVVFGLAWFALSEIQRVHLQVDGSSNTGPGTARPPNTPDGPGVGTTPKVELSPEDRFIKKYVGAPTQHPRLAGQWAVVLKLDDAPAPGGLASAVAEVFARKGYTIAPVFRREIFQDDGYQQLYSADASLLNKLQAICDGIVVGDIKKTSSIDANQQGLVTSRLTLNTRVFVTKANTLKGEFEIFATGGGFSQETAQAQASERLAQELRTRLLLELQ